MINWTVNDLRRLDQKFAQEGVHRHQRPLRAAVALLGSSFSMGFGGNPEVKRITDAYAAMFPEVKTSWPGAGTGIVASVDQVRKATYPIIFGERMLQAWQITGFSSAEEWWAWCREDRKIAAEASLAAADLHDFVVGLNQVGCGKPAAATRWRMTQSNLADIAHSLPTSFSHDSIVQPIHLVAELSLKAALVWDGADPNSFGGKGGHDLRSLAQRMATARPHRDDVRVQAVIASLPAYTKYRYEPACLTRLQVVRLAVGVQFIAASSLRRITTTDLAAVMEAENWPGARATFSFFEGS